MSNAFITRAADDVVTVLNVADRFQPGLTLAAERVYVPDSDLKDLSDLKVTVATVAEPTERIDRLGWTRNYVIDVGFEKRLLTKTNAEVDPLVKLVEDVAEWFRLAANKHPLPNFPDSMLVVGVDVVPIYDPDRLRMQKVFTSVVTLTFKEV